jgi:hypothetical protein
MSLEKINLDISINGLFNFEVFLLNLKKNEITFFLLDLFILSVHCYDISTCGGKVVNMFFDH